MASMIRIFPQELSIVSLPDLDLVHSMPVSKEAILFTGTISEVSPLKEDISSDRKRIENFSILYLLYGCMRLDVGYMVSQSSLYYLDADESEGVESVAMVVKQLVLALPENRLATLLSQQKFEEAEVFARKFDLDPEVHTCT